MDKESVVNYLLNRPGEWDVQYTFTYRGDTTNTVIAAFDGAEIKPKFINARHQEIATFEAIGHSKFTGSFDACMAVSGLRAFHLLNGVLVDQDAPAFSPCGTLARAEVFTSSPSKCDSEAVEVIMESKKIKIKDILVHLENR